MSEPQPQTPDPPVTAPTRTSGKAITSLVLGILSFMFSVFAGLPAILFGALALRDISRDPQVEGKGLAIGGIVTGSLGTVMALGCMVALLLPAVQAARGAAQRNVSTNNMKQIALAMLNHHDVNGQLPPGGQDEQGQGPQLSWRVHLLPYLEAADLYEQFNLDEPWDSPHNKALIEQMPEVFANPGADLPAGHTSYLGVTGPAAVFRGGDTGLRIPDIKDGTSQTIAFMEADPSQAVPWTKPDTWQFNPADPTAGLGSLRYGGWLAAFVDGHVTFLSREINPSVLQALTTADGGEVIEEF